MFRIFIAVLFAAAPLLSAEEYELLMQRKYTVGQHMTVVGKVSFENTTAVTVNDKLVKEEKNAANCAINGEVEILELMANGKISAMKLKITHFEGKENGADAEIFKAGDLIESRRDKENNPLVAVNGRNATPTQSELVRTLLPTSLKESATDDEIFGPGKQVKIGDEWNVKSQLAAKDVAADGIEGVKPEDIKGTSKLADVSEKGGQKCLHIILLMGMKADGMPLPKAPPQIKVKKLNLDMYADGYFPVDKNSTYGSDKLGQTLDLIAGGEIEQNGSKMMLEVSSHRKRARELEIKPLK